MTNVCWSGGVSCGLFLQSGSEGSQLIRRVATFALDPERVAEQVSLFRRRQMVEMKATFIVAVLCHPAEVELALSIGPAANGAFRANNYQEAATIRVDVASLAQMAQSPQVSRQKARAVAPRAVKSVSR